MCGKKAVKLCAECPNSFCANHSDTNISVVSDGRCICSDHEDILQALEQSKGTVQGEERVTGTALVSIENNLDSSVDGQHEVSLILTDNGLVKRDPLSRKRKSLKNSAKTLKTKKCSESIQESAPVIERMETDVVASN